MSGLMPAPVLAYEGQKMKKEIADLKQQLYKG
jgi:hypothetical protein